MKPIHSNSFFINNNPPSSIIVAAQAGEEEQKTSTPTLDPNPNPNPRVEMIRYRECQRNHAAHLGSHVVDGCGEFMPSGEGEGLKCAVCDCHRNFHKRVVEGNPTTTAAATTAEGQLLQLPPTSTATANCYISFGKYHKNDNNNNNFAHPHHQHHQHHHHHPRPPIMMAFGGGRVAAESSSDELNAFRAGNFDYDGEQYGLLVGNNKKRFRTKFNQEQKDKMVEFAEKIGWKIQKQNNVEVQQFCHDVGVKRQVFKVWMHNNKQAMKKKQV